MAVLSLSVYDAKLIAIEMSICKIGIVFNQIVLI